MAFATYPSLVDRVVFITGGASGIGASLVEQFHAQGAKVAFVDRQAQTGQALADRLAGAWFRALDVTDAAALTGAIADAAQVLGPVTVLVNNVADDTRHVAAETSAEAWPNWSIKVLDGVSAWRFCTTREKPPADPRAHGLPLRRPATGHSAQPREAGHQRWLRLAPMFPVKPLSRQDDDEAIRLHAIGF